MRIFLAEWRKLRRPTLFLGSMGAVIAVTALIVSLLFLLIDSDTGNAERGSNYKGGTCSSHRYVTWI